MDGRSDDEGPDPAGPDSGGASDGGRDAGETPAGSGADGGAETVGERVARRAAADEERTAYDRGELVSLLSEHDLAFAMDPRAVEATDFEFDPANSPSRVFPQSVASGGPTPNGVILWTRIAPREFADDRRLALEVARDADFTNHVYRGVIDDHESVRAHDYTVKVDLDGALEPDSEYRYRFVYGDTTSQVGRCRTLPAPESSPDSLRFGVLTCQNYLNGYYAGLHHLAREDVDFVIHVGDFIYESATGEFRAHFVEDFEGRAIELPSGHDHVHTLADYRHLYRTYKSDPYLQEALERHTLIPAWDDHEFANDIYWDPEADAPRADHPRGADPEFMTRLTADAIHAWWEHMPARVEYDPSATALHERFQLWRDFEFGDLVTLIMTDERLFRSPPRDVHLPTRAAVAPENEPEGRTMLGAVQREWFCDRIEDDDARWTVWSDEVLTVPLMVGAGPLTLFPVQGGWDGYTSERQFLTERIAEADLRNFVTITGDMHCYVAGYKQTEYRDAIANWRRGPVPQEKRVGVEFMTPPLTSQNVAEALQLDRDPTDLSRRLLSGLIEWFNPHVEFFDSHHWGYSVVEFTREDCTYVAYSVDKTANSATAEKEVLVAIRVPDGEVRMEDVTDEYRA